MNMLKKILSLVLSFSLLFAVPVTTWADTPAVEAGSQRITIGADLNDNQVLTVYNDFQVSRGDVKELQVTNAEEREYLEGLVSEKTIGTRAISCIYIETREEGEGLDVSTNNISWCTNTIYANALITVGIYDAKVIVSAPFAVSGTAALTGIYKAYEDITGDELSHEAKAAGTQEMVVTGELADDIGEEDAVEIVNELKAILGKTGKMTDEELREEVENIAEEKDATLTDEQIDKLIELVRSLEKLDVSQITDKLKELTEGTDGFFASIWESIASFFESIGDFFSNLFGGGKSKDESNESTESPSGETDVADDVAGDSDRNDEAPETETPPTDDEADGNVDFS